MISQPPKTFDFRRLLLGLIAILCLLVGAFLAFANEGDNNSLSGIFVRVGLMTGVTWLALPVIKTQQGQQSLFAICVILGLVVLVAARPRLFVVGLVLLAAAVGINWLLKKLGKSL